MIGNKGGWFGIRGSFLLLPVITVLVLLFITVVKHAYENKAACVITGATSETNSVISATNEPVKVQGVEEKKSGEKKKTATGVVVKAKEEKETVVFGKSNPNGSVTFDVALSDMEISGLSKGKK